MPHAALGRIVLEPRLNRGRRCNLGIKSVVRRAVSMGIAHSRRRPIDQIERGWTPSNDEVQIVGSFDRPAGIARSLVPFETREPCGGATRVRAKTGFLRLRLRKP